MTRNEFRETLKANYPSLDPDQLGALVDEHFGDEARGIDPQRTWNFLQDYIGQHILTVRGNPPPALGRPAPIPADDPESVARLAGVHFGRGHKNIAPFIEQFVPLLEHLHPAAVAQADDGEDWHEALKRRTRESGVRSQGPGTKGRKASDADTDKPPEA